MKNFVYLDRFKVYSLSSQLMSGVTEYILEETKDSVQDNTEQKGPVASGRIIAEIIEKTSLSVEKKFLHDYAYSLFEERLNDTRKLVVISDSDGCDEAIAALRHGQLVKVKGKAKIVDYAETVKSLKALDTTVPSLAVVTSNSERTGIIESLPGLAGAKKTEATNRLRVLSDVKSFGQKDHDRFFQKHLSSVLEYAFGDSLEVEIELNGYKFSSDLARECLREPITSIVKKYSRFTEVEFCLVGVITQVGSVGPRPKSGEVTEEHNMRYAISMTTAALASLEASFSARGENEIIIDPFAIYTEI